MAGILIEVFELAFELVLICANKELESPQRLVCSPAASYKRRHLLNRVYLFFGKSVKLRHSKVGPHTLDFEGLLSKAMFNIALSFGGFSISSLLPF